MNDIFSELIFKFTIIKRKGFVKSLYYDSGAAGKMFETLLKTCRPETKLCIAAGITTESQFIKTKTVAKWKESPKPQIGKNPAIFLIYK